jgi:hypothetical protein
MARYVDNEHAKRRNKEHSATAKPIDDKGRRDGDDPTPNSETAIDDQLFLLRRNSDLVEDLEEIIRDDSVARPLGEEAETDEDQETMSVTLGLEEFKDGVTSVFLFEGKGGFDFFKDELDGNIVDIIESVVMRHDLEGAVGSILLDIPTRGFPGK